jgi:L-threonine kinase
MASSTADVIGVLAGAASTLRVSLLPAELAHLACRIEPSDSTMFDQLTLFAYRGSGQVRILGPAPELPLLMLDSGLTVDTLTYNARLNLMAVRNLASITETALELLNQGLTNNDIRAVGAAASLSAFNYQTISHNPVIERAKGWAKATRALGIVRAHSGSLVGLLYAPQTDLSDLARWLRPRFAGTITQTRMTGGGYTINDQVQTGVAPTVPTEVE